MPKPSITRRPAAAARVPPPRAPDAIDEAMHVFKGVMAAVTLARQAQRLPPGSPRGLRMLERAVRMLERLDAVTAARAGPSAPADPAGPRP